MIIRVDLHANITRFFLMTKTNKEELPIINPWILYHSALLPIIMHGSHLTFEEIFLTYNPFRAQRKVLTRVNCNPKINLSYLLHLLKWKSNTMVIISEYIEIAYAYCSRFSRIVDTHLCSWFILDPCMPAFDTCIMQFSVRLDHRS